MATLSIASAKGGCGKTTISLLMAAELALDGYKVALLDCDLNQHASAFGARASIQNLTIVGAVDEANVLSEMRKAEGANDVVLIDLPGGSSTLSLKALQRSNFVLIPCQASLPDVRDAVKTVAQVDDAEYLAKTKIARSLIWTRVLSGFESRAAKHVRESVEGKGLPIFRSALMERAAFRELHMTGQMPRQAIAGSAAATNVSAIAAELLAHLEKLAVAA